MPAACSSRLVSKGRIKPVFVADLKAEAEIFKARDFGPRHHCWESRPNAQRQVLQSELAPIAPSGRLNLDLAMSAIRSVRFLSFASYSIEADLTPSTLPIR